MKKKKIGLKDSIGIDIGESSIKIARLKVGGRATILQSYGFFPTPQGAVERGEVKNPELLEEALSECLRDAKIKKGKGVLGISGKDVVVRITELPMMAEEELKDAVGWDLTQYISYSLNDAVYDYYVLGPKKTNGGERLRVLVAAAPLGLVNSYIRILSSLGINLIAIDIKPLALVRLFEAEKFQGRGIYVIVDIGAATTSIVIIKDGEFAFLRDVLLGGRDFTQAIVKGFNISLDEAEHIKKSIDSHPQKEKLYSVITPVMDEFVLEITRSLSYFRENIENVQVFNRLFFTGGGVKLPGFLSYLESGIGIKTEILNPLSEIKYNTGNEGLFELKEFLGVAIGLAKRGLEGS